MKRLFIILLIGLVAIIGCETGFAEQEKGKDMTDLKKMQALEQTPLTDVDEELFLLDGQIWLRSKGEYKFHLGEVTTDVAAHVRARQAELAELGKNVEYDIVIDLRSDEDMKYISALGVAVTPLENEGYYRANMTKSQIADISAQGIKYAIYPDFPIPCLSPLKDALDKKSSLDKLPRDIRADIIFTENFEGTFPGNWSVGDDDSRNGEDYWDDLNCGYQNGNWSAWCADVGNMPDCGYYDDYMSAYMISQGIDVSGYDYVYLSYWLWYHTETNYDFIRRYYSSNGQDWILSSDEYSGMSTGYCGGGWTRKIYRLNNFSTYYMQYRFVSDVSIHNYGGAYVDNIVILGGPSALPSPTITLYGQSEDEINLGETFDITLAVENNGGLSDDGALILSFPTLDNDGDKQYVQKIGGSQGDSPGYQEYDHGDLIWSRNEYQFPADYLTVQYEDQAWTQNEENSMVVRVEPPHEGVFNIYVRGNLGLWPIYRNTPNDNDCICDQQGWPIAQYSVYVGPPVSIEELEPGSIPNNYQLFSNYPNPFNAQTTIRFGLPKASHVTLRVYDLLGQNVATLVNKQMQTGYYQIVWNANNVSSGMYFYKIKAGEFTETRKMLLLK